MSDFGFGEMPYIEPPENHNHAIALAVAAVALLVCAIIAMK